MICAIIATNESQLTTGCDTLIAYVCLFLMKASCSTVKTPVSQSKAAAATDSDNEPTPTHWDPSLASMLTV